MKVTERHLRYFSNEEFVREGRNWLPMYNPRLLILLDVFRHLTGPCILSPHPFALGRMSYPKRPASMHVYDPEDGVRAVDCFPSFDNLSKYPFGSDESNRVEEWVYFADMIGFTGIGLYPQWTYHGKQRSGLHLDVRSNSAQWGWVDGNMVTIEKALETI